MSERAGQGRRALDEALRLLDVLQAARPPAPGATPAGEASPAGATTTAGGGAAAHPGGECAICPVCRGIAHLRRADPDAVDRIAGAVTDLGAALRDLLGAQWPAPAPERHGDGAGVPAAEGGDPAAGGADADVRHPPPRHVDVQRIDVTDA